MLRQLLTHWLLGTFWVVIGVAAGDTFGLYRSTDDGHSWSPVGRGIPADLRTDALGEIAGNRLAGTERGLFVSADDGKTWTRPLRGVPETSKGFDFAVNGGRVYCATTQGVWASVDHGHSWSLVGSELAKTKILSLAVVNGRLVAGTDQHGVWILHEPSLRWEDLSQGLPAQAQVFQMAVQGDTVFAALYAQGVYRLEPAVKTWRATAEEHPLRLVSAAGVLFAGRNPGGVFTSRDGGETWLNSSAGLPEQAPTWCLGSRGPTVLIGTRGPASLMRYDDLGQTWKPSDRGLPAGWSAIAFDLGDHSVLVSIIADRPGPR
jgi:ligand-binding sensor domain-containing protein